MPQTNIDLNAKLSALTLVSCQFARKLNIGTPPAVELRPGHHCAYVRAANIIYIGEEILEKLSPGACCAILAHELGHASHARATPYFPTALVGTACLMSTAALALALGNVSVSGSFAMTGVATCMLMFASIYAKARQSAARLAAEVEADRLAASLVTPQVLLHALSEYVKYFKEDDWCQQSSTRMMKLLELQSQQATLPQPVQGT